jgi:hypothetical protein
LPLTDATQAADACIDGEGTVWSYQIFGEQYLAVHTADLRETVRFELKDATDVACTSSGVLVLSYDRISEGSYSSANGAGFRIEAYESQLGKTNEWLYAQGRTTGASTITHRGGWTAVQAAQSLVFRISPDMNLIDEPEGGWLLDDTGRMARIQTDRDTGEVSLDIAELNAPFVRRGAIGTFRAVGWSAQHTASHDGRIAVVVDHMPSPEPTPTATWIQSSVLVIDENANILWQHDLAAPSTFAPGSLTFDAQGRLWFLAAFAEWLQSGDQVVTGGPPSTSTSDIGLCVFGPDGEIEQWVDLGATQSFASAKVIPLADDDALVVSGVAGAFGLDGPLPSTNFMAHFTLQGMPPAEVTVAEEELQVWSPQQLAPNAHLPNRIHRAGDGRLFGYTFENDSLQLYTYPEGSALPPFTNPWETPWYDSQPQDWPTFEVDGSSLIVFEAPYAVEPSEYDLRVWEQKDGTWQEKQKLEAPQQASLIRAYSDWLVVGDRAYRRVGEGWSAELVALPVREAGDIARLGDRLFIGAPGLAGRRAREGGVYALSIHEDRIERISVLSPSDALPFEPAPPPSGDVVEGPPDGNGFGFSVEAYGAKLVVRDRNGKSYFFEERNATWIETEKASLGGTPILLAEDQLVVGDFLEDRGMTTDSGALHFYRRVADQWTEWKRVVPTQRWRSLFGRAVIVAGNTLLVSAPGYGQLYGGGALFELPLGECSF